MKMGISEFIIISLKDKSFHIQEVLRGTSPSPPEHHQHICTTSNSQLAWYSLDLMLRYKVFNWGSFVIYYRNITGESIWTEDHILTMAFKFGPENLAKITCTEYCHDSVGIRPKALLIDIAYQCTWHTSDHKFGHVRWYNSLSVKNILSKEFKQQRRQDERYVESGQSWLSFVLSV